MELGVENGSFPANILSQSGAMELLMVGPGCVCGNMENIDLDIPKAAKRVEKWPGFAGKAGFHTKPVFIF